MITSLKPAGDCAELRSSIPVDQCLQRIKAAIDSPWILFGSKPVVGWCGSATFRGHKRISYRNSFQTHVVARFSANDGGTAISCRFGMHPAVIAFMAVWFFGVISIGGALIVAFFTGHLIQAGHESANLPPVFGALIPVGMLAFGCVLVGVGRRVARGEAAFLKNFLLETLDAKELNQT